MHFLNVQRLFYELYNFLVGGRAVEEAGLSGVLLRIKQFFALLTPISTVISLLFLTGIVYCVIRLWQIRKEERLKLYGDTSRVSKPGLPPTEDLIEAKNVRWNHIEDLVESDNMNDWRQAILNADIMLDEMLSKMGYAGEDLGAKLKQVDKRRFGTLNSAWEAHKVRNMIAHEGEDFVLTPRRARETINLYKHVFEEFGYI